MEGQMDEWMEGRMDLCREEAWELVGWMHGDRCGWEGCMDGWVDLLIDPTADWFD